MKTIVDAIVIDNTTYHQVKKHENNPPNIDTYDYWVDGDYVVHAVYIVEDEAFLYLEDNIHGNPEAFIEGVMAALAIEHFDVVRVNDLIVLDKPNQSEYSESTAYEKLLAKYGKEGK